MSYELWLQEGDCELSSGRREARSANSRGLLSLRKRCLSTPYIASEKTRPPDATSSELPFILSTGLKPAAIDISRLSDV